MADSTAPMRADARRNYDALLDAAQMVVARDGANFTFEDVASSAGVGKGTLYRHFPTRDHLLAALLTTEFERLADAARDLHDQELEPWTAYVDWLQRFDALPGVYRGLQSRLATALQDDSSAIAQACVPMKSAFGGILARAQLEAGVRKDIKVPDLLAVIASLPADLRTVGEPHPYLSVVLEGTRR